MFTDAQESALYIPPSAIPDGKALRWIRVEAANAPDNVNWAKMIRGGWTAVMRGKYKNIDARFPSVPIPGSQGSTDGGTILFGGLCLCERDIRLQKRDAERQRQETRDSLRTVETYVEGSTAATPRFNASSDVQVQLGRPIAFKE